MPVYVYKCGICDLTVELHHSMSEIDNPSDELKKKTTCPQDEICNDIIEYAYGQSHVPPEKLNFKRVPQAPILHGFVNGTSMKGQEKIQAIQAERKKRSVDNFKKEVMPTLPKREKKYFEKKHGKSE